MTCSFRNFEKLNFTSKSSIFCSSQGQTSKYDRLAHALGLCENFAVHRTNCCPKWTLKTGILESKILNLRSIVSTSVTSVRFVGRKDIANNLAFSTDDVPFLSMDLSSQLFRK